MTRPKKDRRQAIRDKIMSRVEIVHTGFEIGGIPSECHLWTGPTSGNGRGGDYPRMNLDGQTVAVHLVSWTNENGFIPGKKQIDHMCRQRRCVREEHLEMVTHKENQRRMQRAKREAKEGASVAAIVAAADLEPVEDGYNV